MWAAIIFTSPLALLADIAPSPGRPGWDHTPLPPPELLVASALVLGLSWFALARRRPVGAK